MRKSVILGASALVLAIGVTAASAEPFNPVSGYDGSAYGVDDQPTRAPMREGRAAAIESPTPFLGIPVPFLGAPSPYGYDYTPGSSSLEQFHEGNGGHNGR